MNELLLGVNIDHVATLRNARGTVWPDTVQAAFIAEQAGADSITVHLREDRRHITDMDVHLLRNTIQTSLNIEISVSKDMVAIACRLRPDFCCLVPEHIQEVTTEGGLDVAGQRSKLRNTIYRISDAGIQVSLFLDANQHHISAAAYVGAPYIEINTGPYANAQYIITRAASLVRISQGVYYACKLGLKVNAGHGINLHNVKPIAALPSVHEFNIGHSIISLAVMSGLAEAIKYITNLLHVLKSAR